MQATNPNNPYDFNGVQVSTNDQSYFLLAPLPFVKPRFYGGFVDIEN